MLRPLVGRAGWGALSAVALATCATNQAGNVGATRIGDVSHPAPRAHALAALRGACGDGGITDDGARVVRRKPYLQQVTATSAMVGWVTTAPRGEHVDVTLPDGTPVTSARAIAERGAGHHGAQMWATITGLQPDTVYCYRVANGAPLAGRTGFRTAPRVTSTTPVRFLAFGDSGGGGADQLALRDQMYDFAYDLIVHTGDIAYQDGSLRQFEANVFGVYDQIFRNVPFFPAAGNHEYKTANGRPFRDVFALPGDSGEQWYAYDWGQVHFAVIDTEADYRTQMRWLEADLAASRAPWKVVYMHRPPYSSGSHGSDTRLRAMLAPVVERHGVQLVLAGHDHDYERMKPQRGVHYIVTGGGGRGTFGVGTSSFTALSESVIHFLYVEVLGDEMVVHAIDATGKEFDSVVIPVRSSNTLPSVDAVTNRSR